MRGLDETLEYAWLDHRGILWRTGREQRRAYPCIVELRLDAYVFALFFVLRAKDLELLRLEWTVEGSQRACRMDLRSAIGRADGAGSPLRISGVCWWSASD